MPDGKEGYAFYRVSAARKPLPMGEVALRSNDGEGKPGTKEPLRSDGQALCRAMLSLCLCFPASGLALSGASRQLSQRESLWHFAKLNLFARGSPTRGNNDDRRQWRKQGVVVGAAASKTQAKRCGCWVPQPGLGGRKPD